MRIIIITLGAFVVPYLLKVLFNLFSKQKNKLITHKYSDENHIYDF